MLYTSEGLIWGHQPCALGLRSMWDFSGKIDMVKHYALDFAMQYVVATTLGCLPMRASVSFSSMKVLLQRVTEASVTVDSTMIGTIGRGYLLFLCVLKGDTSAQAALLAEKIVKLRLFPDEQGKINDRSILDVGGDILVVSQFTLAGRAEKGNRPDYTHAAPPEEAKVLYAYFIGKLRELGVTRVVSGAFGAVMDVKLCNHGPVTLWLER